MTVHDIIVPLQPEPTQEAYTPEAFAIALAARSEAHLTALAPSFSYVAEAAGVRLPADIREDLRARSDEAARSAVTNFEGRAISATLDCVSKSTRRVKRLVVGPFDQAPGRGFVDVSRDLGP